ncbi:MAG: hypothetical protein Q9187_000465 [Circinaria calcarea]
MLEHPSFRPKIFRTGTGALAGEEDTFPGPDNPSKMRRSVENAEHGCLLLELGSTFETSNVVAAHSTTVGLALLRWRTAAITRSTSVKVGFRTIASAALFSSGEVTTAPVIWDTRKRYAADDLVNRMYVEWQE